MLCKVLWVAVTKLFTAVRNKSFHTFFSSCTRMKRSFMVNKKLLELIRPQSISLSPSFRRLIVRSAETVFEWRVRVFAAKLYAHRTIILALVECFRVEEWFVSWWFILSSRNSWSLCHLYVVFRFIYRLHIFHGLAWRKMFGLHYLLLYFHCSFALWILKFFILEEGLDVIRCILAYFIAKFGTFFDKFFLECSPWITTQVSFSEQCFYRSLGTHLSFTA